MRCFCSTGVSPVILRQGDTGFGVRATKMQSRRNFLKQSLGAAAALGAAPLILSAKEDTMSNPVLGSGRHTYELVPNWAKIPDDVKLGFTHGICVDSQNRVYIFNQG